MQAARIQLHVADGAFPGMDAALAEADGVTREHLVHFEWLSDGSYSLLYRLDIEDPETVERILSDHEDVHEYELYTSGDQWYCFVHVRERDYLSQLLEIVDDHALLIDLPIRYVEGGIAFTVAGPSQQLQEAFAEANQLVSTEVKWSGEYEPTDSTALNRLTARQREAITTAYEMGFYENPRKTSYEEIAEELDCAPSTANELLRRAETALVGAILDG